VQGPPLPTHVCSARTPEGIRHSHGRRRWPAADRGAGRRLARGASPLLDQIPWRTARGRSTRLEAAMIHITLPTEHTTCSAGRQGSVFCVRDGAQPIVSRGW